MVRMLVRCFLLFVAAMFVAFGAWSIIDPVQMTSQLGVSVSGPSGIFEMRGVFGGVSLGAGAHCLAGGILPRMARPALWFVSAYMGGYLLGRLASLLSGDSALTANWFFAGTEAVIFLVAVLLLQRKP